MPDALGTLAWLTLLLPLLAAGAITLFTLQNRRLSAGLSIAAVLGSFLCSLVLFGFLSNQPTGSEVKVLWLAVGPLQVELGLRLDLLSLLMLLIVTGVGSAIHIYSYGYMQGDPGFSRYFASLSLFTFSMLGIVLSNNL